MTDRPTPETDEIHRLNCLPSTAEEIAYRCILTLARRLERQRDEAREAAEKTKAFKRVMKEDNAKLRRERDDARDDTGVLLKEIFNLTQIGDPHPADLPMKALQAIAEMIDEHFKEVRK